MVSIPIELFAIFLGVFMTLVGISIAKRMPVLLVCAGMFIITLSALTDNIILGKIPQSSTTSGSTTTYVMVDNPFIFTQWHKIMLMLIGITLMIIGGIYFRE